MNKKPTKGRGRPKKKATPPINKADYMDVNETAALLKISLSHLYTLTSTKRIPYFKPLGKKLLFDKKEIENWMLSRKVKQVR